MHFPTSSHNFQRALNCCNILYLPKYYEKPLPNYKSFSIINPYKVKIKETKRIFKMESIIKKLFLIGSSALAVAVTLTAIPTQAFECTDEGKASGACTDNLPEGSTQTFSMNSTFKFNIASAFALNGVTGATVTINSLDTITNGSIRANVSSNTPFQIKLSAAEPNLTNGDKSSSINASSSPMPGTNAWGFVSNAQSETDPSKYSYQALTASPATFYRSASGASFTPVLGAFDSDGTTPTTGAGIELPFGVTVAPTLPAGDYSTTVTVTLVDNLTE